MKAHLVLARMPGVGPTPEGAMTLFVAMFASEQEAIDAVKRGGPIDAVVEGVIGEASPSIVQRHDVKPGTVLHL